LGGEDGPLFDSTDGLRSHLWTVLQLPRDDDAAMPPKEKAPLAFDELAVLRWWILDLNGSFTAKLAEHPAPDPAAPFLARLGSLPPPPNWEDSNPFTSATLVPPPDIPAQLVTELIGRGVAITRESQSSPWLQVSVGAAGRGFSDQDLAALTPLGTTIRDLNLSGAGISEAGLIHMKAMARLRRLSVMNTAVSATGLLATTPLQQLESLNLNGTLVSDEALVALGKLPNLRRLYLWNTNTNPIEIESLRKLRPELTIVTSWETQLP
jgi:hypothetical protein